MTESRAQTPVLGKLAVVALILMVVGGYIFEAFVNTYGGLDFFDLPHGCHDYFR